MNELVLVQEALQEEKIAQIAEQVRVRSDVRFVLIAGPSSSSKTTFSHRLSVQLRANGLCPYPIAVDNYFKEREETPRDENGEFDYDKIADFVKTRPLTDKELWELIFEQKGKAYYQSFTRIDGNILREIDTDDFDENGNYKY